MDYVQKKLTSKSTIRKFLKYIILFLIIFLATKIVPSTEINITDAFILAIIGTSTYAILDIYYPSVNVELTNDN